MMNVPGVLTGDEEVLRKCEIAKKYNKTINGHAPLCSGDDLKRYISQGISNDYESSTFEEVFEKSEEGMDVFIRDGSSVSNLDFILDLNNIVEYFSSLPNEEIKEKLSKLLSLDIFSAIVSDDKHPDHILEGYSKKSFLKTVNNGFDFFSSLQLVTSRPAKC